MSQIGEKIVDTHIQLSMHEILAISSDISSYLHDQNRKRRIPVDAPPVPAVASTATVSSSILDANVNAGYLKQLYACPSKRAKATLDHSRPSFASGQ
jgi:hypothetical protein